MKITHEMFDGLRISGKAKQLTEFVSRDERQRLESAGSPIPRMTDDQGQPLTGVNVLIDDEIFGDSTDLVAQVFVPDSALKDVDLGAYAYQVIAFRDLEISTYLSGPRENRRLGISMTASGIDLPKTSGSASTSASTKAAS